MAIEIKDRIKEFKRVAASSIVGNPMNWRKHPEKQKEALRTILKSIGIAAALLVREIKKGKYMLIDGHLRHEELESMGDTPVPVLVLDVDEEEANTLLVTFDPLSGMAESDGGLLRDLMAKLNPGDEAMVGLFSEVSKLYGKVKDKDEEDPDGEDKDDDDTPEPSHVRMVQMFMNTATLPPFQDKVEYFGKKYGTANMTDTVMKVFEVLYKIEKKRDKEDEE